MRSLGPALRQVFLGGNAGELDRGFREMIIDGGRGQRVKRFPRLVEIAQLLAIFFVIRQAIFDSAAIGGRKFAVEVRDQLFGEWRIGLLARGGHGCETEG